MNTVNTDDLLFEEKQLFVPSLVELRKGKNFVSIVFLKLKITRFCTYSFRKWIKKQFQRSCG